MSRRSGACLRCCLVIFAVVSALAVCGPALYWRFKKAFQLGDSKISCPPCICDCPPPLSLLKIAPGIVIFFISISQRNQFLFWVTLHFCFVRLVVKFSEINRYPCQNFAVWSVSIDGSDSELFLSCLEKLTHLRFRFVLRFSSPIGPNKARLRPVSA